jgi:hypothetical protein
MSNFTRELTAAKEQHTRTAQLLAALEAADAKDRHREALEADELCMEAQSRADSAFQNWGRRAPSARMGESLAHYKRRLARIGAREYLSPDHELKFALDDVSCDTPSERRFIHSFFEPIMKAIEQAVYDASSVSKNRLREVNRLDSSGRRITNFVGESFVKALGAENRRVTQFARQDGTLRDL